MSLQSALTDYQKIRTELASQCWTGPRMEKVRQRLLRILVVLPILLGVCMI
jgi:hypothetical protein